VCPIGGEGRCVIQQGRGAGAHLVGLFTILPSPIFHGVWHTQGGSVGDRILRNDRAIVLQ